MLKGITEIKRKNMTLQIELTSEMETRLNIEAERKGISRIKIVQSALEERLNRSDFERRLLAKGLITEIPPRMPDDDVRKDFQPVKVEGKPVSETIIEERG